VAIVGSNIQTTNDIANATTYVFPVPSTPGANNLVLLWVEAHSAITQGAPTVTGTMSAWTQLSRISQWDTTTDSFQLFWAMQAAPSASSLTVAFPGTQSNCLISMVQFSGVSQEAPFQSAQSIVLSASNLAMLLSAPAAGSAVAGGASRALNSAQTASSDFILLASTNQNSPAQNLASEWTSTNRSRVSLFAASAGSMAGIAVEIRPAPAGGGGARSEYYSHYYHRMIAM